MQAALDETVAQGTIRGATAAVIVAGSGTWAGASGSDLEGNALTAETALDPASTPKTVTAAQVLRLVEQGVLGLDDPPAEHLPGGLGPFTANGATIRHLLGMRSGLTDTSTDSLGPNTPLAERVAAIPPARTPAGPTIAYANVNYDLLSAIIENATGQSETTVLEAGVLAAPGRKELEGDDVRAMTLARWGYDLYGGFVLSDASLAQMTDFNGEWYGLGAIDFSHPDAQNGYDPPAVGHGGQSDGSVVRLVAFPDTGIVVAVLSLADDFEDIQPLVVSLRDIAQTTPAPAQ
jgi:D-alanyl-D-alanine carboxypeptidase